MTHPNTPQPINPQTLEVGQPLYGGTFTTTAPETETPHRNSLLFVLPGERVEPPPPGTDLPAAILDPSPDRVPPPCPHFGPCGGCQYQHAAYPAQLALKQRILAELLAELPQPLPPLHIHAAADPWGYRNRIRLRVEPAPEGGFLLGYNRRATNHLLPIHTCPIAAPILLHTAQQLVALAAADLNAARWLAATAELELFTLPDQTAIALQLHLRAIPSTTSRTGSSTTSRAGRVDPLPAAQHAASFATLCEALRQRVPELTGAGAEAFRPTRANALNHPDQPARPAKAAALKLAPISWGKPGLPYPVPLAPTSPTPATFPTQTDTPTSTETKTPSSTPTSTEPPPSTETETPSLTPTSTEPPPSTETKTPSSTETPSSTPTETPSSTETETETTLWVSRPSFFQVNRHLLPELVATVLRAAIPDPAEQIPLAWDLFAGVGLFARALLPFARRLIAVESAPTAVADLRSARLPSVQVVESTVLDFLRKAVVGRDRPDLILLDPPRAGLGLEAAGLLVRLRAPRVVYISCDPTTLARDLRAMLCSGYNLAELHLVDMFPQTFHLETVAVLARADLPR